MKILLIGGPRFLGYHIIEAALARGHEVVLFNRGKTNPHLFPELEKLVGDRKNDINILENGVWDVVIDTCGYYPKDVAAAAEILSTRCEHYTFVSSISVYSEFGSGQIDEASPLATLENEDADEITGETYGPLKSLCEKAVENEMPGRVLNVRPGLIVGPRDPSDRFTYWVLRAMAGGVILAPGDPGAKVQIIDVRDLAEWMINMAETRGTGVYNATGPAFDMTMADVLYNCIAVTGKEAKLKWLDEDFLLAEKVEPWVELPLWVPKSQDGILNVNINKALSTGLKFRPIKDTIRDTLAWFQQHEARDTLRAGLALGKEQELLRKWEL